MSFMIGRGAYGRRARHLGLGEDYGLLLLQRDDAEDYAKEKNDDELKAGKKGKGSPGLAGCIRSIMKSCWEAP